MEEYMAYTLPTVKASSELAKPGPTFENCQIYKKIADKALMALPPKKRPAKRLGLIYSFLKVIIYSWLRGYSLERAEKQLNKYVRSNYSFLQPYYDRHRHPRPFPHQTAINRWLRSLSLEDIERMARAIFAEGLKAHLLKKTWRRTIVVEFDFTYLGYWGTRRDRRIKGTTLVKGAKWMRHYHAAYIHGAGISQFVALHHTAKGEPLSQFMTETLDDLIRQGFKIRWVMADREYYHEDVLDLVKARHLYLLTPAKEYKQLKAAKRAYLTGRKGRIQKFYLGQMAQAGKIAPPPSACWVVLLAADNYHLGRIRAQYLRGQISENLAMGQIIGFITNAPPQGRKRSFAAQLQAYYRQRWQIETAFRVADGHQAIYRSNYDGTRLFSELGAYVLYNEWQDKCEGNPQQMRYSYQDFRNECVDEITHTVNL
jgi:hypothetical protein